MNFSFFMMAINLGAIVIVLRAAPPNDFLYLALVLNAFVAGTFFYSGVNHLTRGE